MSRFSVVLVVLVSLPASRAVAQTTLELDRIGVQPHRDYLRLQPFEQIDTQASNLIITLTDLVLPGNAGHDLRFQLTYNSESDTGIAIWRFGIPGVPMKVLQEQSWPTPGMTIPNTLDATRAITPILEMADGARYRTVFAQDPVANNRNTMNEVWTSRFWRYHRDTHTLELPDGTVCSYDPATLRLTQIADVYGNLVTLTWSEGALQVQQILTNEAPRTVSFVMNDATNLPSTMTFNDGVHDRVWHYAYEGDSDDSTGRLKEIAPPVGPHWRFDYEDFEGYRRLAHLTTPYGGRIDYGYEIKHFVLNGQPELTRALLNARDVIDRGAVSSSGHWSIQCDWLSGETFCHQTTIQTPSARLTYYYGPMGVPHAATIIEGPYGLTRVTIQDPAGTTTFEDDSRNYTELPVISTTYRSAELSSRWISRGGRTYSTTFSYDTGNVTAQYHCPIAVTEIGELARTVERSYVHSQNQPFMACLQSWERVTVGDESMSRDFQYDNRGFLTWTSEAARRYLFALPIAYTRDEGGNVASVTRRGMTTTYEYSGGRQVRVSMPLTTTTRTINPDGTIASETVGGRTTTFLYDDISRVVLRRPPGGTNPVITDYDNTDGSWVREARGTAATTTMLDGFGRPALTQDSAGVTTATAYDAEGHVAYEGYPFTGANGPSIAIEYDALGRVTRRINPDGTFATRAYAPGTVTLTDENGHQTVQTWQAFGHPDDARMASLLDADQKLWSYEYYVLGELRAVVAPDGRTRTWLYNEQHLLSSETHPETETTTYRYDWLGRLSQKIDANNITTTYAYDANNRIETISSGSRVTRVGYESGSDNRQWTSSGGIGSIDHVFTFDEAGRVASRTAIVDGKVFTAQFEYDGNDALTAIGYPTIGGFANRRTVRYDLDAERRVTRVFDAITGRNYATGFTYHPSGGITSYTAGNGVPTTISYDPARYWITGIHSGALRLEYNGHDNVGNVTSIGDVRAGMNLTFGYDALDRLTSVNGPYSSQYAYDVHGNRQDPNNGAAYQYDPNTLRLMSQYGVPFTYDNNGNVKTAPGRSYAYTPENWLQTAVVSNVVHAYEYDADGWRLKKVTPAGVTYYLRGLNGELLTEWTNPGPSGVVRDYIYAGSRLVSAITTSSSLDSGDIVGTLAVGGSPVWVAIATANRTGRLFLNAVAGQTISVAIASLTALDCNWTISLLAPDGTVVTSITPCGDTTANTGPLVLPATGTYVVVVDPAGTVTGSISVGVTNYAATAPTIAGISPLIGVAGGTATITGTNLMPLSAVRLNGIVATVVSSSSTAVTFTVPAHTTPGRISVSTPSGEAVSSDDFFVVPSPYAPSDVAVVGRLNVGSGVTFTIPAANRIGLFVFDRAAGQRFSLTISNQLIERLHIQVLRPDGVAIYASGAVYPFSPYFTDVRVAPVTGTYTLVVDPDEAFTGTAAVSLADVPRDVSGEVVPGGAPVSFRVTTAGQNARISFVGNAGQRIALTTTSTTIPYSGVTIQAADGSHVAYGPVGNDNVVGPAYLPLTGVYDIFVDPFDAYTGAMTLTLYSVEPDVFQSVPTDGTAATITQSTFQRAYLTFTAAAGQHLNGTITATNPGCARFGHVTDPNGQLLYSLFCADAATFSDRALTVSGTYTISLDPNWIGTGTYVVRMTLSTVQLESVSPTSAPTGSTVTIAGTGFGSSQGSSTVTFNGVAAAASAWSSTSITVSVPAGATTGPVVVTVGGLASNAVAFTVLQPPTITSVSPTVGVAGQSITITGANFGAAQGTSTVTFNGVTANATSWSTTTLIATVPAAATTGSVVVTVGGMASNSSTFMVLNAVTYHLHQEASDINRLLRLRAAAPDAAVTTLQSGNIGNSTGEVAIKAFATDPGIPGAAGGIPAGTPITFAVYLRKTTGNGVIYPHVRARLNSDTGALLCQTTGTTPLSSVTTRYVFSCTTGAITMTSTDRIHLWVGVNVTTAPGGNTRGELSIESTNGATDSVMTVQIPR